MVFSSLLFLFRFLPLVFGAVFRSAKTVSEQYFISWKPYFLRLGGTGLYLPPAFFYSGGFCPRKAGRQLP